MVMNAIIIFTLVSFKSNEYFKTENLDESILISEQLALLLAIKL